MRNKAWKMLQISALLLLLPGITLPQHEQQGRVLMINGQAGQANLVEGGGRAHVDVEGLTQITHGSLSFNANHIILNLPASIASLPVAEAAPAPSHANESDPG